MEYEVIKAIKILLYVLTFLATIFLPIYLLYLDKPIVAIMVFALGIFGVIEVLEWI